MFQHSRVSSVLSSRLFSAETVETLMKAEFSLAKDIRQVLLNVGPEDEQEILNTYARQWEGVYGDMSDPSVQANIDAVAAALRATREANARSAKS